jgi:hypothetical protein
LKSRIFPLNLPPKIGYIIFINIPNQLHKMSFWRPPKKTLSGDFASEFGSHSRYGRKLDNQLDVSRLKTITSWLASEKSDLGTRPPVLITKAKDPVKKILDSYHQRNHRYTESCHTDFSESYERQKSANPKNFPQTKIFSTLKKPFNEKTETTKEDYLWTNPDPEQNLPNSTKKAKHRFITPKCKLSQNVIKSLNQRIWCEPPGATDSVDAPRSVKNRRTEDLLMDTHDFGSKGRGQPLTSKDYSYRHRRQESNVFCGNGEIFETFGEIVEEAPKNLKGGEPKIPNGATSEFITGGLLEKNEILITELKTCKVAQTKNLIFNGKQIKAVLHNTGREDFCKGSSSPRKHSYHGSQSVRKYRNKYNVRPFLFLINYRSGILELR